MYWPEKTSEMVTSGSERIATAWRSRRQMAPLWSGRACGSCRETGVLARASRFDRRKGHRSAQDIRLTGQPAVALGGARSGGWEGGDLLLELFEIGGRCVRCSGGLRRGRVDTDNSFEADADGEAADAVAWLSRLRRWRRRVARAEPASVVAGLAAPAGAVCDVASVSVWNEAGCTSAWPTFPGAGFKSESGAALKGSICTVAVMPATSLMSSGTSSM